MIGCKHQFEWWLSMRKRFKEICETLQEVKTSMVVEEMFLSDKNTSDIISKTVCWSMIIGLILLFLVPLNGIVLYHTLQSRFNLPVYSNFMIGCISYALYYTFMKCITEDNLLSEFSNKLIALFAMGFVADWFLF